VEFKIIDEDPSITNVPPRSETAPRPSPSTPTESKEVPSVD
jgi:hypothetical protein